MIAHLIYSKWPSGGTLWHTLPTMKPPLPLLPKLCLLIVLATLAWSAVGPFDRATWWMEVLPVLIIVPLCLFTAKRFPLTSLLYVLIAIHCVILIIGGHYTYARVPLFNDIKEWLGTARNSYDGLGHFAQGFIPAIGIRELLLRTSPLKPGKWLFAIIVMGCFEISAVYELLEWVTALIEGGAADEFLSTQGDIWDPQKDMALAGAGAVIALVTLSRWHSAQLARL